MKYIIPMINFVEKLTTGFVGAFLVVSLFISFVFWILIVAVREMAIFLKGSDG